MNLHPCPLCGESKGYTLNWSGYMYQVCCNACGKVAANSYMEARADAAWNSAAAHAQGLRERIAELEAQLARDELSPEFTDTSRAALLWVLWHHQGGSSPVGQPLRFALGMGAHDHLNENQIAEAKWWAEISGSTTADFHKHRELEAQRVPQWISVNDRLPEKFIEVLVFFDGQSTLCATGQYTDNHRHDVAGWCYPAENRGCTDSGDDPVVTHWMPLPPPPVERAHGIEEVKR